MQRVLLRTAFAATLAGCASSMSAEDCARANWRAVGVEAGRIGEPDAAADRIEACAAAGRPADYASFRTGYQQGLAAYCTFEGVLAAASAGRGDLSRCAAPSTEMMQAQAVGADLHEARRDLRDATRAAGRADLGLPPIETFQAELAVAERRAAALRRAVEAEAADREAATRSP